MSRSMRLLPRLAVLGAVMFGVLAVPGVPSSVRAAEYTLETTATYDVEPESRRIEVAIDIQFTNTTPDPAGQFSVFEELKLAVHDEAEDVVATDADGDLPVSVAVESDVNVATVDLRDQLRFEETAELSVSYALPDTDDPALRVRPSLVAFPVWGFGTSSEVRVELPAEYDVHLDGDTLTAAADGALVSGPITDPSRWLAIVTAIAEASHTSLEATVPLGGGTADIEVRAFVDDEAWGSETLDVVARALPLLEEEIGLPYPGAGELVLVEAVSLSASGIAEPDAVTGGGAIMVAFDQPPFTVVHQLAHVWLSDELVASRWIREGLASDFAQRIAEPAALAVPYNPTEVVAEYADAGFALDSWASDAGLAGESYGYAQSWNVIAELRGRVGEEAITDVLARAAAGIGPYSATTMPVRPEAGRSDAARSPLTTRSFLDHLETVSGEDVTDIFRAHVLTESDVALLELRADARSAYAELAAASDGWGAPDPVAGAMTAWSFEDALAHIAAATDWLAERETLLERLAELGLAAPERLKQAYRAHGGGADARAELNAEREVAESYAVTAEAVNSERSFVEQMGLVGGPDPAQHLRLANGHFAEGDLRGSLDALEDAQQLLASAEPSGIARLASIVLIAVVLLVVAVVLFRRRATYTSAA